MYVYDSDCASNESAVCCSMQLLFKNGFSFETSTIGSHASEHVRAYSYQANAIKIKEQAK